MLCVNPGLVHLHAFVIAGWAPRPVATALSVNPSRTFVSAVRLRSLAQETTRETSPINTRAYSETAMPADIIKRSCQVIVIGSSVIDQ